MIFAGWPSSGWMWLAYSIGVLFTVMGIILIARYVNKYKGTGPIALPREKDEEMQDMWFLMLIGCFLLISGLGSIIIFPYIGVILMALGIIVFPIWILFADI